MPTIIAIITGAVVGAILALGIYLTVRKIILKGRKNDIIEQAQIEAEGIKKEKILQAKEKFLQLKSEHDKYVNDKNAQLRETESRLKQKENTLNQQNGELQKKLAEAENLKKSLAGQRDSLDRKSKEYDTLKAEAVKQIESIAGMTAAEAKEKLIENMKAEARTEAQAYINDTMDEARMNAAREAKRIVITTIQRTATEAAIENAVTTFPIESDEIKGRIIGREGRNIRAIETATGVDLIIDDTPEAVILSGFDPVRREIARVALEKLIVAGRIHPARIEEMVEKAEKEVNNIIKEEGESATFEMGIHNLHPELVKLLGRLKYRTSYGQNVLKHSLEVAHLAGLMAGELGMDVKLAQRAGLLHDIGKALDHEIQGTHVDIGIDVLRKYKESEAVIDAMAAHHGDYEPKSPEAVLVAAADALSAARPGARRETLDTYIKRLQKLEEIANTTPGVEKSFAIQAGREIRIIARPDEVSDDAMALLAREISKKIESELEYPGQIKVNVIRETRAVDYAK